MTVKAATSPAFEALLADLNTMAKATDVNQERIAAGRAAEGHMQSGESLAKSDKEKEEEETKRKAKDEEDKKRANANGGKGEGKEKENMTKSFTLKTEGGEQIEVQDASELLKSLTSKLDETTQTVFNTLEGAAHVIKAQGVLLKSMTDKLTEQGTALASQETLIKSMRDDLAKFGAAPGGRKAVVTVAERQASPATDLLAKAGMPEGMTVDNFFAKAFTLQKEGRLTGSEIALAEAALNSGTAVPAYIVQRVAG